MSSTDDQRAAQRMALQAALRAVPKSGFEVWVTHQFVISELTSTAMASGEGLVLKGGAAVQIISSLPAP